LSPPDEDVWVWKPLVLAMGDSAKNGSVEISIRTQSRSSRLVGPTSRRKRILASMHELEMKFVTDRPFADP
jgi:hypothetical protein